MSAGHFGHHHIKAEERAAAIAMLREPRFKSALLRYTREDNAHRVIFLAGSDKDGTTVFYDEDLPAKIRMARKGGKIELGDPRPFLRWHETVEGILIRLYGFTYAKAHLYATAIERMMLERAGWIWASYQKALKPFIRTDETDLAKGTPKTLLTVAYKGTRWYPEIQRAMRKAA